MKRIFYLLFFSLAFSSCVNLDLEPQQSIDPKVAYKTLNDCENAVRGIYLQSISVYASDYIVIADAFCDNVISFSQGRNSLLKYRNWELNSSDNCIWSDPYAAIVDCNLLLLNLKIPEKADSEYFSFSHIKAEAFAMRALMHFELVRQHGKAYHIASEDDLGVPYVVTVNAENKQERGKVKDNYNKILADLNAAYALMDGSESYDSSIGKTRLRKHAVAALLSRVYLTMHKYDESALYAQLAIDGSSRLSENKICALVDFKNVWRDKSDKGVYFNLPYVKNLGLVPGNRYNQLMDFKFKSEFVVPRSFAHLFSSSDIRKVSYLYTSEYNGHKANHIIKHSGDLTDKNKINKVSLRIIRGAEMYLTLAEAKFRGTSPNSEQEALAALNVLRRERGVLYAVDVLEGKSLIAEIMKQRRLELAFEWDRYHTIKRLGMDIERVVGEGDLVDGSGRPNTAFILRSTDYRFQFPIPGAEMDANPNMVQNLGY
ncbi:MAG: RagB/SusD family nutrient uptake outer membrane protein [Marinifilaceae bacterium]